jgi:tubulin-folding cofactor B
MSSAKPQMRNRDLLALRGYIMAKDEKQYEHVHNSTVVLDLTHSNLVQKQIEIRFDKHDTLGRLRQRIHQKTGTPPHHQHLQIKSAGQILQEIPPNGSTGSAPESYKLGYFGLTEHGLEVHCVDLDPNSGSKGGGYEDTSLIEKYTMSEEEYNQRKGTLRDWEREQKSKDSTFTLAKHARQHREMADAKRQHKLGLPLPEGFFVDSAGNLEREEEDVEQTKTTTTTTTTSSDNTANDECDPMYSEESVAGMQLGNRCQVQPGSRRGAVSFVGTVSELGPGYWVGVTFDEPVGKTDGTAQGGKRYFEAIPGFGGFCRGKNVQVGDFPERDIFEDDSDEDEL